MLSINKGVSEPVVSRYSIFRRTRQVTYLFLDKRVSYYLSRTSLKEFIFVHGGI